MDLENSELTSTPMIILFKTVNLLKLICGLENNMRNLANFDQSTCKCQNWDFDEILLSKVEIARTKKLQRSMCNDTEK